MFRQYSIIQVCGLRSKIFRNGKTEYKDMIYPPVTTPSASHGNSAEYSVCLTRRRSTVRVNDEHVFRSRADGYSSDGADIA